MSDHVAEITGETFDAEVLASDLPVAVDFWATWCGPCKAMAPALAQVAAELAGQVKVVKLDVDTAPEIAARYGVRSVPTVIVFSGGQMVRSFAGAKPAAGIRAELTAAL